jgi:dATP pyrophosphohydrolase
MARAPFQVLVLPYRRSGARFEYAVFRRADIGVWQGIAGGGENDETPDEAASREAFEEAGISSSSSVERLASVTAIAVEHFSDRRTWDPSLQTIPEYGYAVDADGQSLHLSAEHTEVRWVDLEEGLAVLEWESNRTALRELHERLIGRPSPSGSHAV